MISNLLLIFLVNLLCILVLYPSKISALSSSSATATATATSPQTNVAPSPSFAPSRVSLNGISHYIRDTGDPYPSAPIALLLHGLAGSTDSWEDTAPLLYAGGVRAIAIDRVGFGRTERPSSPLALPLLPRPPSFLRESLAAAIETLPTPPTGFLPEALEGILPPPTAVLATALRRPESLAPRLSWTRSEYGESPYAADFAVGSLWPLLRGALAESESESESPRRIYFIGHSAGGPIALRAFNDLATSKDLLPAGSAIPAGVALVSPAVLDLEEDPGAYDYPDDESTSPSSTAEQPPPPTWLRTALFRSVLSLPDAFGVPIARRIFDGRNITEALLNQTAAALSTERASYLASKYVRPVLEFPDTWDVGLLDVYRAEFASGGDGGGKGKSRGRELLRTVRDVAGRVAGRGEGSRSLSFCVVTGDEDRVVPKGASRIVADLLGSGAEYVEIEGVGHLPMDERPEEFAEVLLEFIVGKGRGG